MLTFLFPGQGAQMRGMGGALFDEVKEFRDIEAEVDRLLGYSVRRLCLEGPAERLTDTRYTQPCMYVVNALHYYKAMANGERPELLAGHSLGEYNALLAAGAFDFLTGLHLVHKRGELMSKAREGGMAAVIGLDAALVPAVLAASGLTNLDVANFNSARHTVVSGPWDEIGRARTAFEEAGARIVLQLPVGGPFHSRHMSDCARAFADVLASLQFHPLSTPVIANVTGMPYPAGDPTATIRAMLTAQITSPVRWTDTIRHALTQGATQFREIGPGMTLTKLVKEIEEEFIASRQPSLDRQLLVEATFVSPPGESVDLEFDEIFDMDELESRWFEAHRAALTAEIELLAIGGAGPTAGLASERLAKANGAKMSILRRIDTLELL